MTHARDLQIGSMPVGGLRIIRIIHRHPDPLPLRNTKNPLTAGGQLSPTALNLPIHSNHINHEPHSPPSLMIQILARKELPERDPLQKGWGSVVS